MLHRKIAALKTQASTFVRADEAATAAEYGILAALVAVAIIAAVTTFGHNLTTMFNHLAVKVNPTN